MKFYSYDLRLQGSFFNMIIKELWNKKEFNLFTSLRELIQNALDKEELVTGQPRVIVYMGLAMLINV